VLHDAPPPLTNARFSGAAHRAFQATNASRSRMPSHAVRRIRGEPLHPSLQKVNSREFSLDHPLDPFMFLPWTDGAPVLAGTLSISELRRSDS